MILKWRGGNWGHFFVSKFGEVNDSLHFVCDLSPEELLDRDRLIADDGRTHYKVFLNEKRLVEAGLSLLSIEGKIFIAHYELGLFLYQYLFCCNFSCRGNRKPSQQSADGY